MFDIPRRISLSEQTAASIRSAIAEDAWKGQLPSERRLSEIFKVSRPTIRAALHLLTAEGCLDTGPRRRHRIRSGAGRAKAGTGSVCILTHRPIPRWSQTLYRAFADIRARLAADGFVTEVLVCEESDGDAARRKVEAYLKQNRVFCFILLSIKFELQQWLAAQPVNVLTIGSCAPTVRLPSFEVDMRASARHAASTFLRHGHRHLGLFVSDTNRGGDLATAQGFQEGVGQEPFSREARATIVRHDDTGRMVVAKLGEMLARGDLPTAFLVSPPVQIYTLIFFLQRHGLRVPEDVSVISRDPEASFRLTLPAIAHYDYEGDAFPRAFSRLMLKLVREGRLPPRPRLIGQVYVPGGTVAVISPPPPAPAAPRRSDGIRDESSRSARRR